MAEEDRDGAVVAFPPGGALHHPPFAGQEERFAGALLDARRQYSDRVRHLVGEVAFREGPEHRHAGLPVAQPLGVMRQQGVGLGGQAGGSGVALDACGVLAVQLHRAGVAGGSAHLGDALVIPARMHQAQVVSLEHERQRAQE
jgi:hypothetical protein